MMNFAKNKKYVVVLLCLVLLGCGGEHDDLQSWVASRREEATKLPPEQLAAVTPYTSYTHKVSSKLNAFDAKRLALARQTNAANAPDRERPKEALESFTLNDIKMVGFMEKKGMTQAMVYVSGRVYAVGLGNYMGQDYGKVTAITPDGLTLQESIEDTEGNWVARETQVSLTEAK